jgi:serine/threonine-protein kinase
MMMLHMTSEPPSPSQLRAEVSPRLERVILTALAKRREDRFATMAEFKSELEASAGAVHAFDATEKVGVATRRIAQDVSETATTARLEGGSVQPPEARSLTPRSAPSDAPRARRAWIGVLAVGALALAATGAFLGLRPETKAAPAMRQAQSEGPSPSQSPTPTPIPSPSPSPSPSLNPSPSPKSADGPSGAPRGSVQRSRAGAGKRGAAAREDTSAPAAMQAAVTSPVEPAAAKPQSVAEPAADGYLSLDSAPWSNVLLGGKLLGTTPLVRVPLPPGKHVLTLQNPELGKSTSYVVEIKSGATLKRMVGLE